MCNYWQAVLLNIFLFARKYVLIERTLDIVNKDKN